MLTPAGPLNTKAAVFLEQGAMGGTLNKGAVGVQKPVRLPLQRNAQMRTAVKKDADLSRGESYYQHRAAVHIKGTCS